MKLAFATWLEPEEKKRAHEEWARAAASAPGLFLNVEEASLEELQPLVDAVEQYLAADDPQGAWRIFQYRKVGWRLAHLGYFELVLKLSKLFERVSAKWEITDRLYLIDRIAWAFNRLESQDEEIAYRKKMLELAKKLPPDDAEKVRAAVIPTLLGMGRIQDAELLRSTDPHIRGRILLAKGKYKTASHLLNKEFKMSTGHARTSSAQTLGEALYRNGELSRAEDILRDGLDLATKLEYECCRMSIYSCLTDVALRRRSTTEARQWWDRRTELRRQLNFDDDYNSWLLAVEGDYEAALTALGNEKSGTIRHRISYWIGKARILAFQHKIKEANAALRTAQRLVTKSRFGQFNDEASAIAADLTERRGAS